jgi:DNA-binding beta-propeller fold protein YncE
MARTENSPSFAEHVGRTAGGRTFSPLAAPAGSAAGLLAAGLAAALAVGACAAPRQAPDGAAPSYHVYVANESSDVVSRVRFRPGEGAEVEKSIEIGMMPGDLDGAHGLSVSPDGDHWYLTTAHGTPQGHLWKYRTGTDELVDRVRLGLFPATIGITPDGNRALVVNFNLHGDPEPSTVSVASTEPALGEAATIPVCVRPHGSRVGPDGRRHFSVCGPDDQLTEISVPDLEVSRTLALPETSGGVACGPSWAEPGVEGRFVYVACNAGSEVYEVALEGEELEVTRRFSTGQAPYNLEATPDGRYLLATNKGEGSVSVVDLEEGDEAARIPSSRDVTHGVVASPDSRFAFVSNEAAGSTLSTVDVVDLEEMELRSSVEVRHQAGGIDFWKTERPGPPRLGAGGEGASPPRGR